MNAIRITFFPQRRWHGFIVTLVVLLVSCVGTVSAENSDLAKLEAGLEKLRIRWNVPGMAAGMALSNQVVWTQGLGVADLETRQPVTPDTVFHLASLTKPFAAVLLLQLVEAGQLDLAHMGCESGLHACADP
ncbi:MAG: beta-lactamase family protein [Verrucomicrobia bacterium]|nr:beta-lactamase family protein [Verrucomicrobiota bacterium]